MSNGTQGVYSGLANIEKNVDLAVDSLFNSCEPFRGASERDKSVFKSTMLIIANSAFFAGAEFANAAIERRLPA